MSGESEDIADIERTLRAAAEAASATVRPYPRPGTATKRVVLQDVHDSDGTQREEAVLEHDGAVRITGRDNGPRVSSFFGPSIDNYDWVYIWLENAYLSSSLTWEVRRTATSSVYLSTSMPKPVRAAWGSCSELPPSAQSPTTG